MRYFIDFIISKRLAFLFLFLAIVVYGSFAYKNLPREEFPDIQIPMIYISVNYEGISPEDGEKMILKPLENHLSSISGIDKLSSFAVEGHVSIILEFEAGFNPDVAMQDVRDKVDRAKAELPIEAEEPIFKEIIFSEFPVLNVILYGDIPEFSLVESARDLKDRIEGISQVLNVDIAGDLEETVEIEIDPVRQLLNP